MFTMESLSKKRKKDLESWKILLLPMYFLLFSIHWFDHTGSWLRHVESFFGCAMRILIAAYEI